MSNYGPQIARPDHSADLSAEDFDRLDDAGFADFQDWDARRTHGHAYHLGDYSLPEVFERMRWLKDYCIRLRQRLRESKNAKAIRHMHKRAGYLERALQSAMADDVRFRQVIAVIDKRAEVE